jgi:hypothetical protein
VEERTDEVVRVVVRLPLTAAARVRPLTSWKEILRSEFPSSPAPLLISLINPEVGEVYLCAKKVVAFKSHLSSHLIPDRALESRDLGRRTACYLQGYFKPLRRAALDGSDPALRLQILEKALLEVQRKGGPEEKRWVQFIQSDRAWIQDM